MFQVVLSSRQAAVEPKKNLTLASSRLGPQNKMPIVAGMSPTICTLRYVPRAWHRTSLHPVMDPFSKTWYFWARGRDDDAGGALPRPRSLKLILIDIWEGRARAFLGCPQTGSCIFPDLHLCFETREARVKKERKNEREEGEAGKATVVTDVGGGIRKEKRNARDNNIPGIILSRPPLPPM